MNHPNAKAALFAGLLLLNTPALRAALVTQTIPVPEQALITDIIGSTTAPGVNFDFLTHFDKFDLGLGTLTAVHFDFRYDFDLTVQLGPSGGSGSGSAGGGISIDGTQVTGGGFGNGNGGGPNMLLDIPFTVPSPSGTPDIGTYDVTDNFNEFYALGPGDQGTWEFNATVNISQPQFDSSASMVLKDTSFVTVTYTYTPVPEPTAMGLLALGALPCFLRRRRRA